MTLQFIFSFLICVAGSLGLQCYGPGYNLVGEQCWKYHRSPLSFEEAHLVCQADGQHPSDIMLPKVLELNSPEEQAALNEFLNNNPLSLGIWLAATRVNTTSEFQWSDGKQLDFTNWAPGHPTNNSLRACVEVAYSIDGVDGVGFWRDVICTKGNWVVCEKIPPMSIVEVVLAIRGINKHLATMNGTTELELDMLKNDLQTLATSHNQLSVSHTNLSESHDQLSTLHNSLSQSHSDLTAAHNELAASHGALQRSHNSLSSSHNALKKSHSELEILHTNLSDSQDALSASHSLLQTAHNNLDVRVTGALNSLNSTISGNVLQIKDLGENLTNLNTSHSALSSSVTSAHGSFISRLGNLESSSTSHTSRISTLETTKTQHASKIQTLETTSGQHSSKIGVLETDVAKLKTELPNTVPVNFIYHQLRNEKSPAEIWPQYTWQDVSLQFSGRFFRVAGGNAAAFGQGQDDAFQGHAHSNVVVGPQYILSDNADDRFVLGGLNTGTSGGAVTDSAYGNVRRASETRPINYTIRVWKRTR